jgi:nucleoside-triphosphatase
MKILLTGEPHSGKTTLLKKVVAKFNNKQGFYTNEVLVNGNRVGFEVVTLGGERSTIAHIGFDKEKSVGKYGVDIEGLDNLIPSLLFFGPGQLLCIDEIARIELFSEKFKGLVNNYLDSSNNFIGTMANNFESYFRDSVLSREDIKVVVVTPENRDGLEKELINQILL